MWWLRVGSRRGKHNAPPLLGHVRRLGLDMDMQVPCLSYESRMRIVAWARAAFEQGALPSLLLMPGIAPVFSFPGDRMFQAHEVVPGFQRPVIMHAYGGAKADMEKALASIVTEGWLPMAANVEKPNLVPWRSSLM